VSDGIALLSIKLFSARLCVLSSTVLSSQPPRPSSLPLHAAHDHIAQSGKFGFTVDCRATGGAEGIEGLRGVRRGIGGGGAEVCKNAYEHGHVSTTNECGQRTTTAGLEGREIRCFWNDSGLMDLRPRAIRGSGCAVLLSSAAWAAWIGVRLKENGV
jgi:hypothetical protein